MIEYIHYKGEALPMRISYSVLKHLKKETGFELTDLASKSDNIEYLEIILWYALKSGHEAIGKELTITRDKMEYIFDESLEEFNSILTNAFAPVSPSETPIEDKKK